MLEMGYFNKVGDYIEESVSPQYAKDILSMIFAGRYKFLYGKTKMNGVVDYFDTPELFALVLEANWSDITEDWEWRVNN